MLGKPYERHGSQPLRLLRWYAKKGAMRKKPGTGHPHYKTAHWQKVRELVLLRDNYQCQLRGPKCKGKATSADHVLARVRGGSDSLSNLVAACDTCNKSKGDSLVGPVVTVNW